jgi:hypothetical protein
LCFFSYPEVQPLFANFPGGWPAGGSSTSSTSSTTGEHHSDKGDGGKIAGIVIGVVGGAGLIAGAIVFFVRRAKYSGYKNIA